MAIDTSARAACRIFMMICRNNAYQRKNEIIFVQAKYLPKLPCYEKTEPVNVKYWVEHNVILSVMKEYEKAEQTFKKDTSMAKHL